MSGYCKCGAYHEEDDNRPCAQCKDNAIDIEARQMFGKLAASAPGSGPKLMVLRGFAAELTRLRSENQALRAENAALKRERDEKLQHVIRLLVKHAERLDDYCMGGDRVGDSLLDIRASLNSAANEVR